MDMFVFGKFGLFMHFGSKEKENKKKV